MKATSLRCRSRWNETKVLFQFAKYWFSLQWRYRNFQQKKPCFQQFTRSLFKRRLKNLTVFNGYMWLGGQTGGITITDTCVELLPGKIRWCFHKVTFQTKNKHVKYLNKVLHSNAKCCLQNLFESATALFTDWKMQISNSVQNAPQGETAPLEV